MKAFVAERYGKNATLRPTEVRDPTPHAGEVLVEVHAAGVNLLDAKIKHGEFKLILPYRAPFILGHDVAGVVVGVGTGVKGFRPGDEVYARASDHHIGTFAELIAIPEQDVALKPKTLSMEEAASIPLVGLTAWQALVERGQLQRGQKVFVQAGSGGVGSLAIQLAKHLGAFVATTTGTTNTSLARDLGADLVIDYRTEDFEPRLRDYDLVLHSQDGPTLDRSLRVLRRGGKLVSISGPPDAAFAQEIGASWFVRLVMTLLSWRVRRSARRLGVELGFLFMKASGEQLRQLATLFETAKLRPVIDQVFPFAQTNEALAHVESGRARGKVVIKVR